MAERVERMVGALRHRPLADRHALALSGGEGSGRAWLGLCRSPGDHLVGQPFSFLDPPTPRLIDDLQRILKKTKTAAVMATHDRIEALPSPIASPS